MDRPNSHVINDRGEIQMRATFASVGWVVNKLENDYGIDFDVEIFAEHKSTGEWFKVQLKSSESTQHSADGSFVSESLSSAHARHYSIEISDPCLVIHADVETGRTFWFAPQLSTFESDNLGESVTFRIPTQNELRNTLPELNLCVGKIRLELARRSVVKQSLNDLEALVPRVRVLELFNDQIIHAATACWHAERSADVLRIRLDFIKGSQHQIDLASQYYEFDFIGSANVRVHDWPYPPPEASLPPQEAKLARLTQKPRSSADRQMDASMRISLRAVNGHASDLHVESFRMLPGELWGPFSRLPEHLCFLGSVQTSGDQFSEWEKLAQWSMFTGSSSEVMGRTNDSHG